MKGTIDDNFDYDDNVNDDDHVIHENSDNYKDDHKDDNCNNDIDDYDGHNTDDEGYNNDDNDNYDIACNNEIVVKNCFNESTQQLGPVLEELATHRNVWQLGSKRLERHDACRVKLCSEGPSMRYGDSPEQQFAIKFCTKTGNPSQVQTYPMVQDILYPNPCRTVGANGVFKKSSPNNKLTLYLSSRDLVVSGDRIDKLQGVLLVDPDYLQDRKFLTTTSSTFPITDDY
ncbi:Phosrestin-1 [Gryllus bimaculatus]|nr:Phosrestin-1 [Gryllus bimaculatus]